MTAEEHARKLIDHPLLMEAAWTKEMNAALTAVVTDAIRLAVIEEREACAEVADAHARYEGGPPHPDAYTAHALASTAHAIRTRGET